MMNFIDKIKSNTLIFLGINKKFKDVKLRNQSSKYNLDKNDSKPIKNGSIDNETAIKVVENNQDDSSEYFVDETEKRLLLLKSNSPNTVNVSYSNLHSGRLLPISYFFLSTLLLPLIFIIDLTSHSDSNNSKNYNFLGPAKLPLLNYFKMFSISPLITNIMCLGAGLIGISLILIVHIALKDKFEIRSNRDLAIYSQLIFGTIFGVLGFSTLIFIGFTPLIPNFNDLESMMIIEIKVSFIEFLILVKTVFILSSVIFYLILYYKCNNSYLSEDDKTLYKTWFNYSSIIIIYSILIVALYLLIKLYDSGILATENKVINAISTYLKAFLPYLIHLLIDLLVYSFIYLITNCNICISQYSKENPIKSNEKFEL